MTSKAPSSMPNSAYQLTPAEQIASLQVQIYNLCNRPTTGTRPQTRAQKARELTVDIERCPSNHDILMVLVVWGLSLVSFDSLQKPALLPSFSLS
jgi:hypothetical protein